ncbi:hypothetical protein B0H10DRAFT_1964027 [Mycena sp. CBHHK59/15]|nr:hypothetical protein B0H10DRAFT_1964027 [Mycena sp. CBHHK59/15]
MPSIVRYDARPLGKTLPARPTLLRSRPEAVGFHRLHWAFVLAHNHTAPSFLLNERARMAPFGLTKPDLAVPTSQISHSSPLLNPPNGVPARTGQWSYYVLAEGEEIALKTISTTKKCKSSKKAITFKISPEHSTEAALGEFSRVTTNDGTNSMGPSRSPSPNAEQEIATRSTPRSLSPLHEDSEDDNMPSPTPLEFAPLNEEDDDMPSPGALLEASSRSGSFNIPRQSFLIPSESVIPPAIHPQPRRVLKKTLDIAPPIAATNAEPTATRRSTRVAVPSKRRMVVFSEEEEEEETTTCSVPYCAVTGDVPQIGCSGPASDSQVHICCVGIKESGSAAGMVLR